MLLIDDPDDTSGAQGTFSLYDRMAPISIFGERSVEYVLVMESKGWANPVTDGDKMLMHDVVNSTAPSLPESPMYTISQGNSG